MRRRDKQLLLSGMGQSVNIPLTVAFWVLWLLAVASLIKYLF